MSKVSFRDFTGEVRQDELADWPHTPAVSIRRTASGLWLLRHQTAGAKPGYVRIRAADATAINAIMARVLPPEPAGHPGPTDPTVPPELAGQPGLTDPPAGARQANTKGTTPDPPPLDQTAMKLLKRLEHLQAFDEGSAVHQERLVKKIGHVTGTRARNTIDDLKDRGLVDTRRRLGTWLTESGRAAAARIKSRK